MAGVEELLPRAVAAQRQGDFAAAERDYRQILSIDPQHAISLSNLGVILGRRGEVTEAIRAAEAATQADPQLAVAHFNLGNLLRRVNRPAEAATSYRRVLQLSTGFVQAQINLGHALGESGDWDGAAEQFQHVVDQHPAHPDALHFLGEAFTRLDRTDEAILILRSSLKRSPELPRSYLALARALLVAGQSEEAIYTIQHAIELQPDHAFAHHLLGIALDRVDRGDEAETHFREAVRIRPNFASAWSYLGVNLHNQGRTSEALEALARSLKIQPDPVVASHRLVVLLNSSAVSPEMLRDEHVSWAAAYATTGDGKPERPTARQQTSKIRLGYLFGAFPNGAMFNFLEAILRLHDRSRFHVTCYPNFQPIPEVVDRLRPLVDQWVPLSAMTDDRADATIRADQIDVLVDLNGHTAGNRLLTFARKPARTHFSLFGYPSTTGLQAVDYRITDAQADPPGVSESLGTEQLLRLPELARVYLPPSSAPMPGPLPAHSQPFMTFGALCEPGKLSDACVGTWAQLLNRVPHSRLVLQAGRSMQTARYLTDRFASYGIEPNRLVLIYRQPEAEYFHAYHSIDLALDPFPCNGRTATCDALWMGVPVLSIVGTDCRSRQGASILQAIGLGDFVAHNPEKFIQLSAMWAEQADALAELRSGLRDIMRQSPLMDIDRYVSNLEHAFCQALAATGKD